MVAAPKIMTAAEAEKYKKKMEQDHENEHGDHDCQHGFEEHYDKILVIERPKEEKVTTVRQAGKGGKLNSRLYHTAK